jgi:hypothetical protein
MEFAMFDPRTAARGVDPAWAQALARRMTGPGYNHGALGAPPPNSGNILAGIPQAWGVQRGSPMPMSQPGRPMQRPPRDGNILGALASMPMMKGRTNYPPQPVPGPRYR